MLGIYDPEGLATRTPADRYLEADTPLGLVRAIIAAEEAWRAGEDVPVDVADRRPA